MKRFTLTLLALAATFSLPARAQDVPEEGDVDKAEMLREAQNTLRVLNRISDSLPREPLEPKQLLERVLPKGDPQWRE